MMAEQYHHIPVMRDEVLKYLQVDRGSRYLDCTFGRGGYSKAILDANPEAYLCALDRDPSSCDCAREFSKKYHSRFHFTAGCFDQLLEFFQGQEGFDGIVWDLGVSSPQIDAPERGFSFREEGPLDMRMDTSAGNTGLTAADVVNTYPQDKLADIIYTYGEERRSRTIARLICDYRRQNNISSTIELAHLVRRVVPKAKDGLDPATRTFQALRIEVNDELGQIKRSLEQAVELLRPGARLVVVSFHSLEDRIVKQYLNRYAPRVAHNKYRPKVKSDQQEPRLKILTKKPLKPSLVEQRTNPRSRSAKLRAAEFLGGT